MKTLCKVAVLLLAACAAENPNDQPGDGQPSDAPPVTPVNDGQTSLYEAYNQLHALSQQFQTPIHSPAVVVVGRQTDGKSALIEALMGFQFNHVGGGTKTRRPIAMQMQYHGGCEEPRCYLQTPAGEQQLSLADLQAHIEHENQRLEASRSFDASEIIVRIEYKYCPNLLIIDTPGLLTPAGSANSAAAEVDDVLDPQEAAQARQVEQLVKSKMASPEHIILCVEETNNWHLAPARRLVMQTDTALERTVVVSTKLDTKFAQFGRADELEQFLAAAPLRRRHPALLGGPFFTSVPSGRVGRSREHTYATNDAYREALHRQETTDLSYVESMLRSGGGDKWAVDRVAREQGDGGAALGVSRLRGWLEENLKQRYLRNLGYIVPQLQQVCTRAASQLRQVDEALDELTSEQLRAVCARAAQRFKKTLEVAVRGAVDDIAKGLGQTLEAEQAEGGGALVHAAAAAYESEEAVEEAAAAAAAEAEPMQPGSADDDADSVDGSGGGGGRKTALFGGAQYHRLIKEFHAAVRRLPAQAVLPEDVTNAMGVSAQDDPMHVGRVGCAIALHRSSEQLGAVLQRLFERLRYLMRRMLLFVVQQARAEMAAELRQHDAPGSAGAGVGAGVGVGEEARIRGGAGSSGGGGEGGVEPAARAARRLENLFERQIWATLEEAYGRFLQLSSAHCLELCRRDLHSVAAPPSQIGGVGGHGGAGGGGSGGVGSTMAALAPLFHRASAEAEAEVGRAAVRGGDRRARAGRGASQPRALAQATPSADVAGYVDEPATAWAPAGWYEDGAAVDALVRRTVGLWRRQFAQGVQRKVHALFLMPFLDELPAQLTASLEACCEPDSLRAFDLREARAAMLARREQLAQEQQRTRELLRTFHKVRTRLGGAAAQPYK